MLIYMTLVGLLMLRIQLNSSPNLKMCFQIKYLQNNKIRYILYYWWNWFFLRNSVSGTWVIPTEIDHNHTLPMANFPFKRFKNPFKNRLVTAFFEATLQKVLLQKCCFIWSESRISETVARRISGVSKSDSAPFRAYMGSTF